MLAQETSGPADPGGRADERTGADPAHDRGHERGHCFFWRTLNQATDGFSVHLIGAFIVIDGGLSLGPVNAITMAVCDSAEGESGLLGGLVNPRSG